jgi:hypothetical protein
MRHAIQSFELQASVHTRILAALLEQAPIEAKLDKIAELGVAIAQMKNDLTDTEEALLADKAERTRATAWVTQ